MVFPFCHFSNACPPCHCDQRSKSRVQDLLRSGKGSVRDKLRLLGVYCLAVRPPAAELTELEGLLKQSAADSGVAGADQEAERGLGAIGYLRQQVRQTEARVLACTLMLDFDGVSAMAR